MTSAGWAPEVTFADVHADLTKNTPAIARAAQRVTVCPH
jgi:hypothetical protein